MENAEREILAGLGIQDPYLIDETTEHPHG